MTKRRLGVRGITFIYILTWIFVISRYFMDGEYILEIDEDNTYLKANNANLDLARHASKLISKFPCNVTPLKVLILVTSNITKVDQRALIRRTWGKQRNMYSYNEYKLFFVCGVLESEAEMQSVFEEGMHHRDIIFGNFSDTIDNLPYKAECMFEYAYKYCTYKYLLKVDEDVFINLSRLNTLIHQPNIPLHNLYLGRVNRRRKIERHTTKEASVIKHTKESYLSFCYGGAVVFSADLVQQLIPYFQSKPCQPEDIYIGILVLSVGARATNSHTFQLSNTNKCLYDNEAVASKSTLYSTDNCMERMFFTMLSKNYKDPFVAMYYTTTPSVPKQKDRTFWKKRKNIYFKYR